MDFLHLDLLLGYHLSDEVRDVNILHPGPTPPHPTPFPHPHFLRGIDNLTIPMGNMGNPHNRGEGRGIPVFTQHSLVYALRPTMISHIIIDFL